MSGKLGTWMVELLDRRAPAPGEALHSVVESGDKDLRISFQMATRDHPTVKELPIRTQCPYVYSPHSFSFNVILRPSLTLSRVS